MSFFPKIFPLIFLFPNLILGQNHLENYIEYALEYNVALTQKNLSYEKSLAALEEAKSMFFPTLALKARYSMAGGGRTFDIPTGDLVNPIYSNLNLINAIGKANDPTYPDIGEYPQIPNEQVNFLRSREHETKLQLAFPVFNSAILNNHRIKENLAQTERISVDIYKKELIKEVKVSYYNYLKAREFAKLLSENTMDLVNENLRTAESLFRNQKVTIDEVYAAQAQVKEVEQQLAEAQKNQYVAQAYFNFLLNKEFNSPVEITDPRDFPKNALSVNAARQLAFQTREEFQQLNYAMAAADNKIKLDKGDRLPNLTLVGDYGFQGTDYSFTGEDDFVMGSLVLHWDIFNKTTKRKVEQSRIDRQIIEQKKVETRQQIGLQVVNAFFDLEAARKKIELSEAQKEAAQKAFRLVNKKYTQGQANLVQFTDARTRLTNSEQQLIISKYDYQIRLAEFGRIIGK